MDIGKTAADGAAGICEGAEIFRNESSGLVDHEFAWKGKDSPPHTIDPTTPRLENVELIRAQRKDTRYPNLIGFMEGRLTKEVSTAEQVEIEHEMQRLVFEARKQEMECEIQQTEARKQKLELQEAERASHFKDNRLAHMD